ncbi:putative porin [Dysgonomonas sp. 25]|uniref:putative porin n=1 Tax=Dysgonomonas sp. 25 TaxID=2302933 RepID=UPI0013D305E3|nr:putative porin [Dysgonomonas sp. 25]NDV68193.1 hypothetical protein [Dysgonomonas sp. 25]
MKRSLSIILLLSIVFMSLPAQNRPSRGRPESSPLNRSTPTSSSRTTTGRNTHSKPQLLTDSISKDTVPQVVEVPKIYAWKVTPNLGEIIPVERDTSFLNFHRTTLVEGKDIAVGYLSNLGAPAQSKIFFNRPEASRFIFLDGMSYWYKKPEDNLFLNTKVPYSNIFYQTAGGDEDGEERLVAEISSNFGKRLNVGVNFDYLYSHGYYEYLYNKQFTYDIYASYTGDKYKMHAFFNNNYFNNSENGGLADYIDRDTKRVITPWYDYILNPDEAKKDGSGFKGESKEIPARMEKVWNRLQGRHLFVTNRYDLGDDMEVVQVNDSTQRTRRKKDYIAPASIIYTFNYTDQRRLMKSSADDLQQNSFFNKYNSEDGGEVDYLRYTGAQKDHMSYYSLKNTVGFAMNEGFRSWTKFGLTVYGEVDLRKYSLPSYPQLKGNNPSAYRHESENAYTIGAELTKSKGKYLQYKAVAEKRLNGDDLKLQGEVKTMLYFKDKQISAKANAYIKTVSPSMFQEKFYSKYISWNESFNSTKRAFIGGEIDVPFLNLRIKGGVENIKEYIYYDTMTVAQQKSGNVQVMGLQLQHRLDFGAFHWENQIAWQKSTDDDVIPLPQWSFYTNLYLQTKIAKVLDLQLGVDAHFHTKYHAPGYDPLTMQFYNQDKMELGGAPLTTLYLNLNLKRTRFFVMYYNATDGMFESKSANTFPLYRYSVNPASIKFGLSWKFNN